MLSIVRPKGPVWVESAQALSGCLAMACPQRDAVAPVLGIYVVNIKPKRIKYFLQL